MIGNQQPKGMQSQAGGQPASKRSRAGSITRGLLRMVAIPLLVAMLAIWLAWGTTGVVVDVLLAGGWFAILAWSFYMT